LRRAGLAAHLGVAVLAASAMPDLTTRLVAPCAVALVLGARLRHQRRHRAHEPVAVLMADDARWYVTRRDGRVLRASLVGVPFVQPWLTVLRLRAGDGIVHNVTLLADNAPDAAWRRLRVRLRHPRDARSTDQPR
jgi:hypothetical protein